MSNTSQYGTPMRGLPGDMGTFSQSAIDTISRQQAGAGTGVLVSGNMIIAYFTADKNLIISQITTAVRSTTAAGLTLARYGLFTVDNNGNITLVARTASDTSIWANNTSVYTKLLDNSGGFPAQYQMLAGVRYGAAVLAIGTTMPVLEGPPSNQSAVMALDPALAQVLPGQVDIPTNAPATSLSSTPTFPWMRFS